MGYLAESQRIDNEEKRISSALIGLDCEYAKPFVEMVSHELIVKEPNGVINYDGLSGSPVFYHGDICGIVTRGGNGHIYFRDLSLINTLITENQLIA